MNADPLEIERECETHGPYTGRLVHERTILLDKPFGPFYSSCPTCAAEHRAREADAQRRESEAQLRRAVEEAGIPRRFQQAKLDGSSTPQVILAAFAKDFAKHRQEGSGLVLLGPCGTGKTFAACGLLLELVRAGTRCAYVTAEGLGREIRATFRRDATTTEGDTFEYFASVPLLVVDELGSSGTAHTVNLLNELIAVRYEQQIPTVFVTNANRTELEAYLGQRAADRIAETCRWVPMTGASRRRSPAISTAANRSAP